MEDYARLFSDLLHGEPIVICLITPWVVLFIIGKFFNIILKSKDKSE